MILTKLIYYLPGRGGRLTTGLGQGLIDRGLMPVGRETRGEFKELSFQEQIKTIALDLQTRHWNESDKVIANSYGAYLFLHAQSLMPPYPGEVLLLSPILGAFENLEQNLHFAPPFANRLFDLAQSSKLNRPRGCSVHVGSDDWQSPPHCAVRFGALLDIPVTIVPEVGHMLGKEYVGPVLDRFLGIDSP